MLNGLLELIKIIEGSVLQQRFQLHPASTDWIDVGWIRGQLDEIEIVSFLKFGNLR